ncbi:MAG TPA: PQQ-dependent sugar dehydrogenase [Acidimicrobiales bacterium]|nr:PQQ-dependent sugar dehydrogenase [Acidimicrobiales bacterium]
MVALPLVAALLGLAGCDLRPGFNDYVVFSGLNRPTAIEFSPDGRVFVAEKRGVVKVFDNLADRTPTVFADLRTQVHNYWDRGLLGLALHPDFPANPSVYVLYTRDAAPGGSAPRWGKPGLDTDPCPTPPGDTADGCVVTGRLSRLTANGNVWTGSEDVLISDWCQQYPSHSIGSLAFGADGALYASGGEGASFNWRDYGQDGDPLNPCGDPPGGVGATLTPPTAEGGSLRAQDVRTPADPTGLSGTIIRIDPDTGEAMPDNPMAASPDPNTRRIIAYGLRNPFRFTVRPGTDELWIGDVGQDTWDEINRSIGGDGQVDNFGWPCMEGAARMRGFDILDLDLCESLYAAGSAVPPFFTYHHDQPIVNETCSATHGTAVSGVALSPPDGPYPDAYDGALFFSDASRGCIWAMRAGPNGQPDPARIEWFHQAATSPVELEIGPGGELWYVDLFGGAIHRIGYSSTNSPPDAAFTAAPASGDPPLTVSFDAAASSDRDPGDQLAYAWDLDGDGELDATGRTATMTYDTIGARRVRLTVVDKAGAADWTETTIRVGTQPPVPVIDTPADGAFAAVGDAIGFTGHATVSGQEVPPSALSWSADMLHCTDTGCHRHPDIFALDGSASGSLTVPDHAYPAHIELHLAATWDGETVTTTRRIDYRTVDATLTADASGATVELAAHTGLAPVTQALPVGSRVTISAADTVSNELGDFLFAGWSDGGARTHEIVVPPQPITLTAHYASSPPPP